MPLVTRVKNILLSPGTEWAMIRSETDTPQSLLGKYVVPLTLIPAIALFIGYGLIGIDAVFIRVSGISKEFPVTFQKTIEMPGTFYFLFLATCTYMYMYVYTCLAIETEDGWDREGARKGSRRRDGHGGPLS